MVFPFSARSCFLQAEARCAPGLGVEHLSFLSSKGPSSMEVKTIRARPRRQEETRSGLRQTILGMEVGVRVGQEVLRAQKERR